mmetsp:Transcript_102507/g.290299  ORF Transcript_102507/g.290299 Transcript_102507/m.290299 type:complete len:295 (+) Transcript_102507:325-1209(+)
MSTVMATRIPCTFSTLCATCPVEYPMKKHDSESRKRLRANSRSPDPSLTGPRAIAESAAMPTRPQQPSLFQVTVQLCVPAATPGTTKTCRCAVLLGRNWTVSDAGKHVSGPAELASKLTDSCMVLFGPRTMCRKTATSPSQVRRPCCATSEAKVWGHIDLKSIRGHSGASASCQDRPSACTSAQALQAFHMRSESQEMVVRTNSTVRACARRKARHVSSSLPREAMCGTHLATNFSWHVSCAESSSVSTWSGLLSTMAPWTNRSHASTRPSTWYLSAAFRTCRTVPRLRLTSRR